MAHRSKSGAAFETNAAAAPEWHWSGRVRRSTTPWGHSATGLRVLGANTVHGDHGVFTVQPETLTKDFFVHLLERDTERSVSSTEHIYEAATAKPGRSSGPVPPSTSSLARISSSEPSLRCTPATTRSQSSYGTSRGVGQNHETGPLRASLIPPAQYPGYGAVVSLVTSHQHPALGRGSGRNRTRCTFVVKKGQTSSPRRCHGLARPVRQFGIACQ